MVLSDEQRAVLRMVVEEERSVFFTGSAGEFGFAFGLIVLCFMSLVRVGAAWTKGGYDVDGVVSIPLVYPRKQRGTTVSLMTILSVAECVSAWLITF